MALDNFSSDVRESRSRSCATSTSASTSAPSHLPLQPPTHLCASVLSRLDLCKSVCRKLIDKQTPVSSSRRRDSHVNRRDRANGVLHIVTDWCHTVATGFSLLQAVLSICSFLLSDRLYTTCFCCSPNNVFLTYSVQRVLQDSRLPHVVRHHQTTVIH